MENGVEGDEEPGKRGNGDPAQPRTRAQAIVQRARVSGGGFARFQRIAIVEISHGWKRMVGCWDSSMAVKVKIGPGRDNSYDVGEAVKVVAGCFMSAN